MILILSKDYGLKTDEEWYVAFDDLGDDEQEKYKKINKEWRRFVKRPKNKNINYSWCKRK